MAKRIFIILLVLASYAMGTVIPIAPQTFNDELFTIYDNGDPTKKMMFEVGGITTDTIRTITMPDYDVVANAFIDWTNATANLKTTGSGEFGEIKLLDNDYIGWWSPAVRRCYISTDDEAEDLIIFAWDDIRFKTNQDVNDYISFRTFADVPRITTFGSCNLEILPSGGTVLIDDIDLDGSITMDAEETVDGRDVSADGTTLDALVTESTTVTAPLVLTTYDISIPAADTDTDGYLSQTDWDTFNDYVQVGHLPLAGGTVTGDITIGDGSAATRTVTFDTDGNDGAFSYNHSTEAFEINDKVLDVGTGAFEGKGFYENNNRGTNITFLLDQFKFNTTFGGTMAEFYGAGSKGPWRVTINPLKADIDWQVSSDNVDNLLNVDAELDVFRMGGATNYTQVASGGTTTFAGTAGLVIPSGTAPAPDTQGAVFVDTDESAHGSFMIYSDGAWRKVCDLP